MGGVTPRLIVSVSGLGPGAPLTAAVALADALDARRVPATWLIGPQPHPEVAAWATARRRVGDAVLLHGTRTEVACRTSLPAPARARGRPAPRRRTAQPRRPRPGRRRVRRPGVVDLGRHPDRPRRRRRGPAARRRRGAPPRRRRRTGHRVAGARDRPGGGRTASRPSDPSPHRARPRPPRAARRHARGDRRRARRRRPRRRVRRRWVRASSSGVVPRRRTGAAGDPEDWSITA